MKKYLFLTLCLCMFLFPFIGNAKTITKADLEAEAAAIMDTEAFTESEMSLSSITVGNDTITFKTKDDKTFVVNYHIENDSIETITSVDVENGMTNEQYKEVTSQQSLGVALAHIMISHIQGVEDYIDSFLYFVAGGNSNVTDLFKNRYVVDSEYTSTDPNIMVIDPDDFGDQVVALARHMYDNYSFKDKNNIYQYSTIVSTSNNDTKASILTRVAYDTEADYTKMNDFEISLDDLVDYFGDTIDEFFNTMPSTVEPSVNTSANASPKTSTNVKVPNTALSINKIYFILGLITILVGLLFVDKVIKRKSN